MSRSSWCGWLWNGIRRDVCTVRICRQWSSLDLPMSRGSRLSISCGIAVRLRPRIVVCQLDADLARVFPFAVQSLPQIALASSRHNDVLQGDQGFSNQIRLLVLAEDGNL